jgi:hypothetical protein
VYTVRDNVNLVDIFTAMQSSSEKMPDEKDNSAVKKYFEKVYPDLDFDRVYSSDMKKMVKWFGVLKSNEIEIKLREPEEVEEPVAEGDVVVEEKAPAKEEKPKAAKEAKEKEPAKKEAKAATAKPAAKKEKEAEEETKEAPKKKAAPKAKKEETDATETPAKKNAASSKDKTKK